MHGISAVKFTRIAFTMRPTVFLLKGRKPQDEKKVPFKMQMPMQLKNSITGKNSSNKERGCLYEISLVLSCLEAHNYEDKSCLPEVTNFHNCYKKYLTNKRTSKEHALKGILTPNATTLKYNQVNQLLKKYPQV